MQVAANIVKDWCRRVALSVNPSKTNLIPFTRKRKIRTHPDIQLFCERLVLTKTVKYLGLIIDSKLDWGVHIETRVKKSCLIFGQCRKIIGKNWRLSPLNVKWLYTAIVRPFLTHGALVWWEKAQQVTVMKRLSHLQRLACLAMTGAMQTTPTAALEIITGLTPLDIFIESVARSDIHRLKVTKQLCYSYIDKGHTKLWTRMVAQEPLFLAPNDRGPLITFTSKNFNVIFPNREDWFDLQACPSTGDTVFYTDGSLQEGLAGAGIFSESSGLSISIPLGGLVSVFQAEVYAILVTAHYCLTNNSSKISSRLILECRKYLIELALNNVLKIIWVPGHSNISGNE
jgi:hypothetical protein